MSKDVYGNSFFPRAARLLDSACKMLSFDLCFKSIVNRHLDTIKPTCFRAGMVSELMLPTYPEEGYSGYESPTARWVDLGWFKA